MDLNTQIFLWFNGFAGQSAFFDGAVVFLADYLRYVLLALFAAWAFRRPTRRKEMFFLPLATALVARYIVTVGIRWFYHHPRPFDVMAVRQLVPESGYSFPSGHMTFFFALSAVLFAYDRKWGTWFFIASAIMGIARIVAGVHYPLDIAGGIIVGVLVGWAVYSSFTMHTRKRANFSS